MTQRKGKDSAKLEPEHLKRLFRKQLRGGLFWAGTVLFLWLFILLTFIFGRTDVSAFKSVSICGIFMILMYVPLLWIAKWA